MFASHSMSVYHSIRSTAQLANSVDETVDSDGMVLVDINSTADESTDIVQPELNRASGQVHFRSFLFPSLLLSLSLPTSPSKSLSFPFSVSLSLLSLSPTLLLSPSFSHFFQHISNQNSFSFPLPQTTRRVSRIQNHVNHLTAQQVKQVVALKHSQKLHDKKNRQQMCRNAMERGNKVREANCKGGRQKRSDMTHCKVISRANNNRKC